MTGRNVGPSPFCPMGAFLALNGHETVFDEVELVQAMVAVANGSLEKLRLTE